MHRAGQYICRRLCLCRGLCDRLTRWTPCGLALLLSALQITQVHAAAVSAPFMVTVPQPDPSQAVQEAMRVELVRLTGAREAATDPALAPVVDRAGQYVQIERRTASGQTQVLFDAAALRAAIEATGRSIWDLNRPLLWVSLPVGDPTTDQLLRARLMVAAQERGLPILIAAPLGAAGVASSASPGSPASTGELLDAAHRAGANAALLAQPLPASPGSLQWTLAAPTTGGQWTGSPELAIENVAEALAGAARATDQVPLAEYRCQISGVADLASLVNVLAALQGATGISELTVEDVQGTQLTLRLKARASAEQLQRMLASDRLQAGGTGTGGVLEYRYLTGP